MKHLYLLSFLLIFCTSCQRKSEDTFDYGQIDKAIYINKFFNLKFPIPEGWHVQSKEQKEASLAESKEILSGENEELREILNTADVTSVNLLTAFQFEVGSPVDFSPGITIVAENIAASPGIKTGRDYLFNVTKLMEMAQVNYVINPEINSTVIDDKTFYIMTTTTELEGTEIKQTYYTTVYNRFALNLITVTSNKEQEDMMLKIVNAADFNK